MVQGRVINSNDTPHRCAFVVMDTGAARGRLGHSISVFRRHEYVGACGPKREHGWATRCGNGRRPGFAPCPPGEAPSLATREASMRAARWCSFLLLGFCVLAPPA